MRRTRYGTDDKNLYWDGRAHWWSRHSAELPGRDSDLWMCASDLSTNIWSHFYRLEHTHGRNKLEPVRLESCSAELAGILINSLPFSTYRVNLPHVIRDFTKMVAQEYVVDGDLPFELRAGWNTTGKKPVLKAAKLMYLPPDSLMRLGAFRLQVVPPEEDQGGKGRIIRLDPKRLLTFSPPAQYARALQQMRNAFPVLGESQNRWMTDFGERRVREEFKSVMRTYDQSRAKVSAPVGWNGRGLFSEYTADFQWVIRQLRWHRFCIEVRDSILMRLRDVFATIGEWRNERPHLVWDTLPTVRDVEAGESMVMEGSASFEEVLRPFGMDYVDDKDTEKTGTEK